MSLIRLLFLTNIPSPYRTFLFSSLNKVGQPDYLSYFRVFYSRSTEKFRKFDNSSLPLSHPYLIDSWPFYLTAGNIHFHFNPYLLLNILLSLRRSTVLILGASWWSPNNLLLLLLLYPFKRIFNLRIGLWVEENKPSKNYLIFNVKRFTYLLPDFFIVPGSRARSLVSNIIPPYSSQSILLLPNLVDVELFSASNLYDNHPFSSVSNIVPSTKIDILIAARFIEQKKGIINFIQALDSFSNTSEFRLFLVGDGPDVISVSRAVNLATCEVLSFGNVDYQTMSYLYHHVDVFCLPSYEDPAPLSLVEAAYSSLPIICSCFCGNSNDVVSHLDNGFIFNPYNHDSIHQALDFILSHKLRLHDLGTKSYQYVDKIYNPRQALTSFLRELLLQFD